MIQYFYTLRKDSHDESSDRPLPPKVVTVFLIVSPGGTRCTTGLEL